MNNKTDLIDRNVVLRKFRQRRERFANAWLSNEVMPENAKGVYSENLECSLIVSDIQTIDAVEVIRCKSCTAYRTRGCANGFGWCKLYDMGKTDIDFCSSGERNNNEKG